MNYYKILMNYYKIVINYYKIVINLNQNNNGLNLVYNN